MIEKHAVLLQDELRSYVEAFDFSIVKDKAPHEIVEQHRKTRFYAARFGGGLVRQPKMDVTPPAEIHEQETRYVQQLLEAYTDKQKKTISSVPDLDGHPNLRAHFQRQRKHFYLAEELRNFTRDNLPEDGCYERLQSEIHDGIIDIAEGTFPDGYERLKKTIEAARTLQIDAHPLKSCLHGNHRSGICHQLANEDKLTWVP